jgi:hypothetical protein
MAAYLPWQKAGGKPDQCMKVIPGDGRFHLVEEDLSPCLLLGVDLLVIAEPQLK